MGGFNRVPGLTDTQYDTRVGWFIRAGPSYQLASGTPLGWLAWWLGGSSGHAQNFTLRPSEVGYTGHAIFCKGKGVQVPCNLFKTSLLQHVNTTLHGGIATRATQLL